MTIPVTAIAIRTFEPRDEAAVLELWEQTLSANNWQDPADSLRRKRAVDDGLLLVACDADTIIGTVMGGYDGHRGWIYAVAVRPSHRRRGVGTRLMQAIEQRLIQRRAPKINLQVRPTNQQVIAFYEKLGWCVEGLVNLGKRTDPSACRRQPAQP